MNILVTGAEGFIGKNLCLKINENNKFNLLKFTRDNSKKELRNLIKISDFIIHLAAVNRTAKLADFKKSNEKLTEFICDTLIQSKKKIPIIFTSSSHVKNFKKQKHVDYVKSKLNCENILKQLSINNSNPVLIYRLKGIFGKWCKPNYNSVVATFCYNIANNFEIKIHNLEDRVELVHVDLVIKSFLKNILNKKLQNYCLIDSPKYQSISVSDLAKVIKSFKSSQKSLEIDRVGTGFIRSIYSTYLTYIPESRFIYDIPKYSDQRGKFVEIIKTKDSGQISYFTIEPGKIRGGHYHHTKTEKFLVMRGKALFYSKNILTKEECKWKVCGTKPQVIETIPGWAHNIKNIGNDEVIVMLWASEKFDKKNPDTFFYKL
tara:strand:- start:415 stop:1539 length:1125 start_codon:yes stop_codon:yes gene_type:complete